MNLFNYSKPGKGVDKDVAEPLWKIYFDVLYRKFWDLIKLNILYVAFSLPLLFLFFVFMPLDGGEINNATNYMYCIGCLLYASVVGLGFIMPGFTYVLRNYANETHAFILSDFWEYIKKHFKKGFLLFVIDTAVCAILYICLTFYNVNSTVRFFVFAKYFLTVLGIVYFMMHFYIYQIMITFDTGLLETLKNAFILTFGHLLRNVLLLIGITAIAAFTFAVSIQFGYILCILISVSLIAYTVNFVVLDVILKYSVTDEDIENASHS